MRVYANNMHTKTTDQKKKKKMMTKNRKKNQINKQNENTQCAKIYTIHTHRYTLIYIKQLIPLNN